MHTLDITRLTFLRDDRILPSLDKTSSHDKRRLPDLGIVYTAFVHIQESQLREHELGKKQHNLMM